jgi:hypothetical protein
VSDRNLFSFNEPSRHSGKAFVLQDAGIAEPPETYSDTLKFSNGVDSVVVTDEHSVWGGGEDCIDMNAVSNCTVRARGLIPRGKFCATIKGGTTGAQISGALLAHGTEVDFDLGNWSDQSSRKTGAAVLDVVSVTGDPITYRVLHAERPVLPEGTGPWKNVFPWVWLGPLHTLIVAVIRLYMRASKR